MNMGGSVSFFSFLQEGLYHQFKHVNIKIRHVFQIYPIILSTESKGPIQFSISHITE